MKNRFRKFLVVLVAVVPLVHMHVSIIGAAGPKVSEDKNKHNLSSGYYNAGFVLGRDASITYKAKSVADGGVPAGQQICIFCHTPHNANVSDQAPLWNRAFSTQTFSRYSSGTLQIRVNSGVSTLAQYGAGAQPDGASKLCLSCHDGVSGLGAVRWGGTITMVAGKENIAPASRASFNPSTNKMKFGHHPVSFKYTGGVGGVQEAISSARKNAGLGGGFGFAVPVSGSVVKLDKNNKMQCTTCHNAHQNQSQDLTLACYNGAGNAIVDCPADGTGRKVVPFWVKGGGADVVVDHDDVCISCHRLTGTGGMPLGTTYPTPPSPFPYP